MKISSIFTLKTRYDVKLGGGFLVSLCALLGIKPRGSVHDKQVFYCQAPFPAPNPIFIENVFNS